MAAPLTHSVPASFDAEGDPSDDQACVMSRRTGATARRKSAEGQLTVREDEWASESSDAHVLQCAAAAERPWVSEQTLLQTILQHSSGKGGGTSVKPPSPPTSCTAVRPSPAASETKGCSSRRTAGGIIGAFTAVAAISP